MSEVNRVLVFKSNDARKQDPRNKPGNFTTRFTPEMILDRNEQFFIALDHLSMYSSWYNISPEYGNDKLKISKDKGKTFETITFPPGAYDSEDINNFIQKIIGNEEGIKIFSMFPLSKYSLNWMKIIKLISEMETLLLCWDSKRKFSNHPLLE